ncbi:MAG: UbiA family prenyltransferase [Candidatus Thiodiazotropha sp.]
MNSIISFVRRIQLYFTVMYPWFNALLLSTVMVMSVKAIYLNDIQLSEHVYFAIFSVFLAFLLLRTYDELKDTEVDKIAFPNRPLVTGLIHYKDVKLINLTAFILLIIINLNKEAATSFFLLFLSFTVLSWQWWLFPKTVSNSFFLTFITHQPLVFLLLLYIMAMHSFDKNLPIYIEKAVVIAFVYWLPFIIWEIARKIRAPEQEDRYLSYSKRWGLERALAVIKFLTLVDFMLIITIWYWLDMPWIFLLLYLLLTVALVVYLWRFSRKRNKDGNHVKLAGEIYLILYYFIPWLVKGTVHNSVSFL